MTFWFAMGQFVAEISLELDCKFRTMEHGSRVLEFQVTPNFVQRSKQMKKLITIALALAFALPMTTVPSFADPWYQVMVSSFGGAEIRSRAHGEGKVKCKIPAYSVVHRNHGENWSRWIYVRWKRYGADWNAKDVNGKYCPDWNRHGWVDKRRLIPIRE